jgi:hypothetical protein
MRTHVGILLLVIGNDGFEQIAKPLVAARFVFPRDLKQQALNLIEAAQAVPRNRVREARAQHDEFMLAFALRRSGRATNRIVQTAQRAACAGIHIANPDNDGVRLIIEIEAVIDQLVEVNVLKSEIATAAAGTRASVAAGPSFTWPAFGTIAPSRPAFAALTAGSVAFWFSTLTTLRTPAFTRRTALTRRSILAGRAVGLTGR